MCLQKEAIADDHGLMSIYQQMMTVDLFQTQYGGWSNLPWHIKFLMAAMLFGLLAAMFFGIYYLAYLKGGKIKKIMKKLTDQKPTNKKNNTLKSKVQNAKSIASSEESDSSEENDSNRAITKKPVKKQTRSAKQSPQNKLARKSTPRKSVNNQGEADKNGKGNRAKTDIGKELIKTAEKLEDIHEKIEESNKPVKGMDKLQKVKKAHDKLEKVKKKLDKDD